jgi:Protein of unknown function (DUF3300)
MKSVIVIISVILLVPGGAGLTARAAAQQAAESVQIPADQLDALVAPIAIYPDHLLSQVLVASTYPLELMQLQQWLQRNKGLKDKALVDAVSKQPWDPSVQAMAALPDLVKRLADDIQWTTDLGNAFLAQQGDVMNAIQRMRRKAEGTGALTSNEHQKVETQMIDNKSVVVVEQANPEVVYVPSYNPEAVYGPPVYPYPEIYYPSYSTGGVVAASAISWGVGVAMGAAWGGGWGWGMGWGHGDVDMNFNNSFNRAANINRGDINRTGRGTWQHNPQHRGGAPYADRATANRFGSNARGDSLANRQKGARDQITRQKGNLGSVGDRGAIGGGAGNRGDIGGRGGVGGGAGNRGDIGGRGGVGGGAGNRGDIGGRGGVGGGAGNRPNAGDRGGIGGGAGNRPNVGGGNFGGGDRVGNRSVGGGSSMGNRSGFGGGSSGFSGRSARSSSSRGSSSFGGGGRGGGGRGGGGRGGGGRGGGGRGGGGRRR